MTLAQTTEQEMSTEDRLKRVDALLCILFSGLVSHPLANTLVPPDELQKLRDILPREEETVS